MENIPAAQGAANMPKRRLGLRLWHTLAFLAGINGTPIANLGVSDFGQVGDLDDLYREYGIDADTITGAAWDLIDGPFNDRP